jgi:polyisoprenyl-phosphate glycosyltransferase
MHFSKQWIEMKLITGNDLLEGEHMLDDKPGLRVVPVLAIILPCFNESETIHNTVTQLLALVKALTEEGLIAKESYLFFVDDGSSDDSWEAVIMLHHGNKAIKGIKLSQNFGHQAALLAGLAAVTEKCDAAISIDADLQQDPLAIRQFVIEFHKGADVVLGIRRDRNTDGWFKNKSALAFYTLMKTMGVNIIPNHADYRLLSKRALEALALFPEPNIFLRAICLRLGFKVCKVFFDVKERAYGTSKYSLQKMLRLALHGITSFSIVPLRIVAILGFIVFLLSIIMGGYVVWRTLFIGDTVPGWASTALPIYFIGGIQLLCLGVVGEYIGQIYNTVKNRPRWICEHKLD